MQLLRRSVDKWGSRDFFQFLKWSNLLAITCRQEKVPDNHFLTIGVVCITLM